MREYRVWMERTLTSQIVIMAEDDKDAWDMSRRLTPDGLEWVENTYEVFNIEEIPEPKETIKWDDLSRLSVRRLASS